VGRDELSLVTDGRQEVDAGAAPGDQQPERVHFKLPAGYWDWSKEQQKEWAREVALALQRSLGVSSTAELSGPKPKKLISWFPDDFRPSVDIPTFAEVRADPSLRGPDADKAVRPEAAPPDPDAE
jgi:hypothetical protein